MPTYDVRTHWNEVASRIEGRGPRNFMAGDDTPFTRYHRANFLKHFERIDFRRQRVLEVGSGPGGNLAIASKREPSRLVGCDISERMVRLARSNLADLRPLIEIVQTNGRELPFSSGSFDLLYTVTVLQHVDDEPMLQALLREMCRVTLRRIVLFEDTFWWRWEKYSHVARPISDYERHLANGGFRLVEVTPLSNVFSHIACSTIRRLTSSRARSEGEPVPPMTSRLQRAFLSATRHLDRLCPVRVGLTKMVADRG